MKNGSMALLPKLSAGQMCIRDRVEAGFEHGLHMIVPAYANSTQDNEYMTGEQSYRYYNEFLWPDRYADCVPMDKALELLKK